MSHDNPFATSDNPFATNVNGSVPAAAPWGSSSTTGAWGSSGNGYSAPEPPKPLGSGVAASMEREGKSVAKKEADLARREAELNRREAELRRLELELKNNPGARSAKNWPRFCPIMHHDIAGDIPAASQSTVRQAYWAWLMLLWCLFFNFAAVSGAFIGLGDKKVSSWLWSGLYLVGGSVGSYLLWYSRLYNAAMKDSAMGYAIFFLNFCAAHLVFCIWSAVAPPVLSEWSHAGFMSAISAIGDNTGVGVMYFMGAAFWTLESLWSIWVLKSVYRTFRGQGMSAAQVQREAAHRAAAAAV